MHKTLVTMALAACLLFQSLLPSLAEAGGGRPGGRSSSASSRSSSSGGKSYSSGSRPNSSKPSAPSPSTPRGKSYSSGPATSPAKPPAASSHPQSSKYSSGASGSSGNASSSSSQKPTGAFDSGAAAAQRKAESKEAFRGQSKTAPAPSGKSSASMPSRNGQDGPSSRPASGGAVSGKSYTSDAPSPASSASRQPTGGTYDTNAAKAQRRQESKNVFTRGQQPRSTWTDSSNQAHPIDPRDRQIDSLRRDLDHERWVNRDLRQRRFYGDYYGRPGPVVGYHDPYSNLFWTWLLLQSLDHRAHWAYHHRDSMDQVRYRDLLAHDAQLEARVRQLEAERTPRDPTFVPEGMKERDLMYSDEYVDAVYNPQPRTGHVLGVLVKIFLVIGLLALVTWLVFIKRWGGSDR